MLSKEELVRMMYKLSRIFAPRDGSLTDDLLDLYYIGLMDYETHEIARAFKWIAENQVESWFPTIMRVKQVISKTKPAPKQLPSPPKVEPSERDKAEHHYQFAFIFMYVFGTIYDPTIQLPVMSSGLSRKPGKGDQYRPLKASEKKKFAEFLKQDSDNEADHEELMNERRLAFVAFRLEEDGFV